MIMKFCEIIQSKYCCSFIVILLGTIILTTGCGKNSDEGTTDTTTQTTQSEQVDHRLDNEAFAKKMEVPGVVILDVRSGEEYAEGHLVNAQNLNVNGPDFATRMVALDKSKTYLIYCKSGARSEKAYELMVAEGFTNLFTLPTGIKGWTGEIVN